MIEIIVLIPTFKIYFISRISIAILKSIWHPKYDDFPLPLNSRIKFDIENKWYWFLKYQKDGHFCYFLTLWILNVLR